MLYNLHLLRVIAALGVVYFHTTSSAGLKLDWDIGSRGVDVFFVISGFIIAYIGSSNAEQFFRRRLIRVAPFYWAATLCVFAMVVVSPASFRSATSDVAHLISSLLFVPHTNPITQEMHPTLELGWSLNFELFFYVVFALALRISQRWSPLISVGWIILFVLAIHGFAANNDIMNFYARPIVLEFCYGIGVFYLFAWCTAHKARLAAVPGLKLLLIAVFVGSLVALGVLEEHYRDTIPRYLVAGIPSFFIVTSALLLERLYGLTTKNKLIYLLGEASYIIYLVHPYIVFTVLRVGLKHADRFSSPVLAVLIVGLLALTSAIAIAVHVWFEKPVMAFLRGKLTAPRAPRAPALPASAQPAA
ncbi:MAG TPA: acyltransferase [Kofleriaceae bacterium]|nr:acyltransferase [Kofleriaceae bacterium]